MKRIGVFLFYNPKGIVYDYVTYLLADIVKSLSELIIVCNGYLNEDGRNKLLTFTNNVYERPNVGFDAAAWQDAILNYCGIENIREYDELILYNDSFFGPFYSFKSVFDEMDQRDADFWGLTVHGKAPSQKNMSPYGVRPRYLQTYFMAFRKKLLESEAFESYWRKLPVYESFQEMVEKHACVITKHFEDLGFKWDVYCDTGDLESDEIAKNCSHHMFNSYEMVVKRKLPIIKRKAFIMPKYEHLRYGTADTLSKTLEYIHKNTAYDTRMIWDYLLENYHLADIKESLNLSYVLSSKYSAHRDYSHRRIAIIAHLFFPDLFEESCRMICNLPTYADIYVTTSSEEKKKEIRRILMDMGRPNADVRIVQPRGRDLSALLVGCAGIPRKYDYLCFVHDKKSTAKEFITVGAAFKDLIMYNVLQSEEYVANILETFEENPRLGLLVPPNVYHGSYFNSSLNYWTICYDGTQALLERLGLKVPLARDKMPVAVGTVFWCRPKALKPLFEEKWECDDFPAEPMAGDGTVSHSLERSIPYVAQSQKFFTGTVLTDSYASAEIENYRYMMSNTMRKIKRLPGTDFRSFSLFLNSLERIVGKKASEHPNMFQSKYGQRFRMLIKRFVPTPLWNGLVQVKNHEMSPWHLLKVIVKKVIPVSVWNFLKKIKNRMLLNEKYR